MLKQRIKLGCASKEEPEYRQVVTKPAKQDAAHLSEANLVWVGLGGIIGAGFFLASGLSIHLAGPGVVLSYILGALILANVAGALTSLSVNHPVRGSFRVYADELLGTYAGFLIGWTFWISAILSIGSETVAMAVFSKFWLPGVPLWLLALLFANIVIGLNAFGIKNFGRVESVMSKIKVAALVGFIAVGGLAMLGLLNTTRPVGLGTLLGSGGLLPGGLWGVLRAMLPVIFTYGGISVIALSASEVENPRSVIPRATIRVMLILVLLYSLSMLVVVSLRPWPTISVNESPLVAALDVIYLPWLSSVLNAVILVAAFSVMTGAFFSAMLMLMSLSEAHQAPSFMSKQANNGVYYGSLMMSALGVLGTILISYLLPAKIYQYLTSASAYFSFLNWTVVLICYLVLRRKKGKLEYESALSFGNPWTTWINLGIIAILVIFSLSVTDQRMGFYWFLGFVLLISGTYFIWKNKYSSVE